MKLKFEVETSKVKCWNMWFEFKVEVDIWSQKKIKLKLGVETEKCSWDLKIECTVENLNWIIGWQSSWKY